MFAKLLNSGEWYGSLGKLALRLAFGGTLLFAHGIPKLQAWSEKSVTFPDPLGFGSPASMGLAISAEVFAAALLVAGLLTRLALVPLIITMGMAFFVIHAADAWAVKEMAFLYLAAFVALLFVGPGRFSVDALLSSSKKNG